jgi:hypothetical protein
VSDILEDDYAIRYWRDPAVEAQLRRGWQSAGALEWGGMIMHPGTKAYSIHYLEKVPQEAGIYMLCEADGRMIYVGQSKCLHQRLHHHYRYGKLPFHLFGYRLVPEHAVKDVEIAHIRALKPEANRLYEACHWPAVDAMTAAIKGIWHED